MKKTLIIILISFVMYFNNTYSITKGSLIVDRCSFNHQLSSINCQPVNPDDTNIIMLESKVDTVINIPSKLIFINVDGGNSQLHNKDISKSDLWKTKNGLGYQVDLGLSWFIKGTKKKGFQAFWGVGLGLSSYSSTISFDNYNAVYTVHDKDGESFKNNYSYKSVKETTGLMMLELPIFIELGSKNHSKMTYYFKLGLSPSISLPANFKGEGTYSNVGYYNIYNTDLKLDEKNAPGYGFYTDKSIYQNTPKSKLSSFNITGLVSAGIILPVAKKSYLKLGINAKAGLMDLSKNSNFDYAKYKYQLNVNNIFEDNKSKTINRFVGIEIGYLHNFGSWFYK